MEMNLPQPAPRKRGVRVLSKMAIGQKFILQVKQSRYNQHKTNFRPSFPMSGFPLVTFLQLMAGK
jgi:hypothetical protein